MDFLKSAIFCKEYFIYDAIFTFLGRLNGDNYTQCNTNMWLVIFNETFLE